MLNQVVIVGRLVDDIQISDTHGTQRATMTLAVSRPFKNVDGKYDNDFIDCVLWNGIATKTTDYCKKGDVVGVKGRLQTRIENEIKYIEVIAEKVTFLSTSKEENDDK